MHTHTQCLGYQSTSKKLDNEKTLPYYFFFFFFLNSYQAFRWKNRKRRTVQRYKLHKGVKKTKIKQTNFIREINAFQMRNRLSR